MSETAPKYRAKTPSPPALARIVDRLLDDVMSGKYSPGMRLPPERDLATALGVSRPTVREALRRLEAMRLIQARQGSGVTVRPSRDWTLPVLPYYLRNAAGRLPLEVMERQVRELLEVRRSLILTLLKIAAERLRGVTLRQLHEAALHTWEARTNMVEFLRRDVEFLRVMLEAAGMYPSLWLINAIADVYVDLGSIIGDMNTIPEDYLVAFLGVAEALERGDGTAACALMAGVLDKSDEQLFALLAMVRTAVGP